MNILNYIQLKIQITVINWYIENKVNLNVNKCKNISFYKKCSPLVSYYCADNFTLKSISTYNDLSIILSSDLSFGHQTH